MLQLLWCWGWKPGLCACWVYFLPPTPGYIGGTYSSLSLMLHPQSNGLLLARAWEGRSVAEARWSHKSPLPADLGQRADEAGVLSRYKGHTAGTSPLCGQLRVGRRDCAAHHTRLLPQLLHESGVQATPCPPQPPRVREDGSVGRLYPLISPHPLAP